MTENQQKEEISKAYLHAIAARCGYKLANWTQDDDCMDVTLCAPGVLGQGQIADPKLDLQLKCTSNPQALRLAENALAHQLTAERYEKLRRRAATPKLLVVLLLPEARDEWITHSGESLILRRCAYYMVMTGKDPLTPDTKSTYVKIPLDQIFSPDAVRLLMERLSRDEVLS